MSKGSEEIFKTIFNPKSIAVIGVTPTPGTVPYDIFHNILATGYRGVLYPIAPGKRPPVETECVERLLVLPEIERLGEFSVH